MTTQLSDFKISTDFNILYNKYDNKTKYVAAYSQNLKVTLKFLESITQCDSQLIISEFITFVSNKKALKDIEHCKNFKKYKNLEISKLYINDVINADKGGKRLLLISD